jgi:hypothetical protein
MVALLPVIVLVDGDSIHPYDLDIEIIIEGGECFRAILGHGDAGA